MLNSSHQTMSRQAQLPPRCPFQRKPIISSPTNSSIHNYFPRHHKSPSQGSILEDQPEWLDDLLNDQEVSSKSGGGTHRRSSSDSVVDVLPSLNLKQNPAASESEGRRLELDCTYGPNSPRARSESAAFSDNGIVSALSEYISQNPLQVLDGSLCIAGAISSDARTDVHGADGDHNTDMKPVKRHSGQRSRVRKLQYIAELEKTVEVFQAFESELAVKVAALLQQRVTLTIENTKLKQKMTRLRQEKLFMEGQYQSLRKEADRLRANLARSPNRHARSYSDTSIAARAGIGGGEAAWHTSLGLDKLNLNN